MLQVLPNEGERGLILGQVGSGKTALAISLLLKSHVSPFILYDIKEEEKFALLPKSVIVTEQAEVDRELDNQEIDYIIYRPSISVLHNVAALDLLLLRHYDEYRHVGLYIDELHAFTNRGYSGPGLTAILTRSRSRAITTIMASQRPAMIPRWVISEAQVYYIFRLVDKRDRQILNNIIPDFDDLKEYPLPMNHRFYFFRHDEPRARLMAAVQLPKDLDTGYVNNQAVDRGRLWV